MTTSWDDGDDLDYRVLELLKKYNLKGTFYAQKNLWNRETPDGLIKLLAEEQEVGAHTLNHVWLNQLDENAVRQEIEGSKKWLEEIVGKPIRMFCYPGGFYRPSTKEIVKSLGFSGARTTESLAISMSEDPFEMPTTLQVYPHPILRRGKLGFVSKDFFRPLKNNIKGIKKYNLSVASYFSWVSLAKGLFDRVNEQGGVFHLWGHSWEIDKYKMWGSVEKIFKYISKRQDFEYLTNSQIFEK